MIHMFAAKRITSQYEAAAVWRGLADRTLEIPFNIPHHVNVAPQIYIHEGRASFGGSGYEQSLSIGRPIPPIVPVLHRELSRCLTVQGENVN